MSLKLKDFDAQGRAYIEYIANEELAAKRRIGKLGNRHCFYCGSDTGLVLRCECGFGESFKCSEPDIRICKDCVSAHVRVASHIRDILKFPRVNRVSSRRFQGWRMLSDAAEAIDEKAVADGRLDLADTLYCALCDGEDLPWEASTTELRRVLFKSFRKVKFTRFQELAVALQQQQDNEILRSTARLLRLLR
jgi:hypothetical protein